MHIAEYVGHNIVVIEPHGPLTMETIQFFRRAVTNRLGSMSCRKADGRRESPAALP